MTSIETHRRCSQLTTKGKPCRSWAMAGSDRCATHLSRAGRDRKLTVELQGQIVALVRGGSYLPVACAAVGIGRSTFYDWWARGDPANQAPGDAPYRAFREEVEKARAFGEAQLVATIVKEARDTNWQAAAWMLERMFPERWARVSQRDTAAAPAAEEAAAPFDPFKEFDELAEARRKRLSGG